MDKDVSKSENWGGRRKGAGRKRDKEKLAKDRTKVVRISECHYARIKSGVYDDLISLIYDYKCELEDNKKAQTSPRWAKMSQFLKEVEEIFGSDYRSWVE